MARELRIDSSKHRIINATRVQRGYVHFRHSVLGNANFSGVNIDQLTFDHVYLSGATDFSFFRVEKLEQKEVSIADDYKLKQGRANVSFK